jgi:hypothetical protein
MEPAINSFPSVSPACSGHTLDKEIRHNGSALRDPHSPAHPRSLILVERTCFWQELAKFNPPVVYVVAPGISNPAAHPDGARVSSTSIMTFLATSNRAASVVGDVTP